MWMGYHKAGLCTYTHTECAPCQERDCLVYAEEVGTQLGGREIAGEPIEIREFHLRFQRTLPSFESSISIPRSASSLRMQSEAAKSRRWRADWRSAMSLSISASLGPLSSAPKPSARSFSASLSSIMANTRSKLARNSLAAATSPWRKSPLSIAIFVSRKRSKAAARARAVLRSSESPASNSSAASLTRAAIPCCFPAGNLLWTRRAAKLRSRSTELAACCNPSNVKFSCLRYGTLASAKRSAEGLYPFLNKSRSV